MFIIGIFFYFFTVDGTEKCFYFQLLSSGYQEYDFMIKAVLIQHIRSIITETNVFYFILRLFYPTFLMQCLQHVMEPGVTKVKTNISLVSNNIY